MSATIPSGATMLPRFSTRRPSSSTTPAVIFPSLTTGPLMSVNLSMPRLKLSFVMVAAAAVNAPTFTVAWSPKKIPDGFAM